MATNAQPLHLAGFATIPGVGLPKDINYLQQSGLLKPATEHMYRWLGQYHPRLGLQEALIDPSDLIV